MTQLYFAYGSNLNHKQMIIRCKDSRYIKSAFLEGYKLSFCAASRDYGVANIVKKKDSKVSVPGGIWEISESDEKELDIYEGYPTLYTKDYFKVKYIVRKSAKRENHKMNLQDVKIASNIIQFVYFVISTFKNKKTKYFIITISP